MQACLLQQNEFQLVFVNIESNIGELILLNESLSES